MDGDSCKELDEVVLRGMACMAAELIVSVRILATCSSTYSPVRTSQEAHSVSIK
jgi:hypothetical protein